MLIRDELPGDFKVISEITADAFRNHPHGSGREPFIIEALRSAGVLTASLVAEAAGAVVGHVCFSPVGISDGAQGWHTLGPIAVRPDRQRGGIGQALVRAGLDRLSALGAAGCLLVGDPAYYGRFGFRRADGLSIPGVPAEYFMVLPLGGGVPAGSVQIHRAFFEA